MELNFCFSPSEKQHQDPSSEPPLVDLSTCHCQPAKKAVDLPIRLKGNLKRISSNLLRVLGAENKDVQTV